MMSRTTWHTNRRRELRAFDLQARGYPCFKHVVVQRSPDDYFLARCDARLVGRNAS